ncbi:MAG TPA: peptidylprolyl isomerase [Gemmatimonadales bacterium]|nr:peptidylprolyl isomerase [Gemmatimonadales bacterium]
MRRFVLASMAGLTAVGLAGCNRFRDAFTAHANTAAEAGGATLSADRLAKLLTSRPGVHASTDAANFVTNLWVDYTLFAEAATAGKLPKDSASAARALWPEMAELKTNHWHDSLVARRPQPDAAAIDSVYGGDQIRVFQHILFTVPAGAKPDVKAAARKQADATLAKIKRGADFGELASELSGDPGSKADHGFLPPSPRGSFVPAFDSAGWKLAPGAVSSVVETQFGLHIIKRPAERDVRDRLAAWLGRSAGASADSSYMENLAAANKLEVAKSAPADMKAALEHVQASRSSTQQLSSFTGGGLSVGEYVKWLQVLPPQYSVQLRAANDTMLSKFARVLSLNLLLLRQADSAHVQPTGQEWREIYGKYNATLDSLGGDLAVAPGDTGAAKAAGDKVDRFFDRLVSGEARLRPMPVALGSVLRENTHYSINEKGIAHAVQLAEATQARADSAAAKAGTKPPGAFQPAPGPAPVPEQPSGADADSGKAHGAK